jgi:hypothetical protein
MTAVADRLRAAQVGGVVAYESCKSSGQFVLRRRVENAARADSMAEVRHGVDLVGVRRSFSISSSSVVMSGHRAADRPNESSAMMSRRNCSGQPCRVGPIVPMTNWAAAQGAAPAFADGRTTRGTTRAVKIRKARWTAPTRIRATRRRRARRPPRSPGRGYVVVPATLFSIAQAWGFTRKR